MPLSSYEEQRLRDDLRHAQNQARSAREAKEEVKRLNKILDSATALPFILGVVVAIKKDCVIVTAGTNITAVELPKIPGTENLRVGASVAIHPKAMGIVKVFQEHLYSCGEMVTIRRVIDENTAEIQTGMNDESRVVMHGLNNLSVGDRVALSENRMVITRNFGKSTTDRFLFNDETNISWNDIGGLENAKEQLIEAIEFPYLHAEMYKKYGKKLMKGVLLYGPPGCGKTMLAKAVSTSLAKVRNKKTSKGLLYVKGPELLSKWVGETEATIKMLFEQAKQHKKEHGYPAVLFIDEADALLARRGGMHFNMSNTVVPMFLAEMDGMEDSGAFVLLATNRPDSLDPAVVRDGRIDRKVEVSRPGIHQAKTIMRLHLRHVPLYKTDIDEMADTAAAELYSDSKVFYRVSTKDGEIPFCMKHVVNGAMLAGIVDQASSSALHRDVKCGKMQGVTKKDIVDAVEKVFNENRHLDHRDALESFVESFKDDIVGVQRQAHASA